MLLSSFLMCGLLLGFAATEALAEPYARPGLLVEPAELAKSETATAFVILDARERAKYDAGHVRAARWVDHAEWAKAFGDGHDAVGWSERLSKLGLDTASQVVVYDDNSAKDAARVWWILRYWGLKDVRILNGGWKAWQTAGRKLDTQPPDPAQPTHPQLVPLRKRLATKNQLLASLPGQSLQIVDARSEGEFCGTDALSNKRAGAIPGAKHLDWTDLIDRATQRFKPAGELAKLFADAGIDLHRPTATHCQSGGRSSVMAFGLELMGAEEVSNYYPSWAEWGNANDTPVVPGIPKKPRQATD